MATPHCSPASSCRTSVSPRWHPPGAAQEHFAFLRRGERRVRQAPRDGLVLRRWGAQEHAALAARFNQRDDDGPLPVRAAPGRERLAPDHDRRIAASVHSPLGQFRVATHRRLAAVHHMATARGRGLHEQPIDQPRLDLLDHRTPRLIGLASAVEVDHLQVAGDRSADDADCLRTGGYPRLPLGGGGEPALEQGPPGECDPLLVPPAQRRKHRQPGAEEAEAAGPSWSSATGLRTGSPRRGCRTSCPRAAPAPRAGPHRCPGAAACRPGGARRPARTDRRPSSPR